MNDIFDYDEYLEPKKEKVLLDTNKSSSDKKKTNKKKINSNKSPNKKKMNEENKKNLIRSIILIVALIGLVGAFIF